jgi:4-hydroxyproline epimerase
VECPGLGRLTLDIAYGGNLVQLSAALRQALNEVYTFEHPEHPEIRGLSHILWTGAPKDPRATARNAVFYGDKAIDRSPCGTGTSARMAQWVEAGRLQVGDEFIHESIIGSLFHGRVEQLTTIGNRLGIVPSIGGWARMTGYNTIFIDDRDPYAHGFQVN